jgi:hypothetical protein
MIKILVCDFDRVFTDNLKVFSKKSLKYFIINKREKKNLSTYSAHKQNKSKVNFTILRI